MALDVGRRLGPYEIQSPLGAGGMGEVYQATDTRLDRTVAIKVLPSELAADPERRERFEREAKAIAALNHPHICTLHDVGHEDGTDFLVMEHLEGESLADRLKKGALSLDQALTYAIQIADALDKAHRQGITHRDLKPGNIMLTKAEAKLLDFGLAKLTERATTGEDATKLADALTAQGTILGTFQYMAPEQLEGGEADARSDIWAFGCVLYEMLTGQKTFEGASQASLIGAILKDEPRAIADSQPTAPDALARVVGTCLAKAPDDRWQSARDLHRELAWIRDGATSIPAQRAKSLTPGVRQRWMAVTAAALLAGLAGGYLAGARRAAEQAPVTRLLLQTPASEQLARVTSSPFVVSPDGRRLVYTAQAQGGTQLYVHELDAFEPRGLPGTEDADAPFFSPDGEWIGFFAQGALKRVAVAGGAPATIVSLGSRRGGAHSATWGPDDTIVFYHTDSGLLRVSASGGVPQRLTSPAPETWHAHPDFQPDGTGVMFTIVDQTAGADRVARVGLAGGEVHVLEELGQGAQPRHLPSGHLVYLSAGTLLGAPFDSARQEVAGPSVALIEDILLSGRNFFVSVSSGGTLAYSVRGGGFAWVDRAGRASPLPIATSENAHVPRFSPDGRQLAYRDQDRTIRLLELGTGSQRRLAERGDYPVWARDGAHIAFTVNVLGASGTIWLMPVDGEGAAERLWTYDGSTLQPMSWSPDGAVLTVTAQGEDTGPDIWLMRRSGEATAFLQTASTERAARFSPDGRWLAYVSDESGQMEVYVRPFETPGGGAVRISTDGGTAPVWSPDGRELFFRRGTAVMAAGVTMDPAFHAEPPQPLFDGPYSLDQSGHAGYDIAPDGERFLMVEVPGLREIHVVRNWVEELKRLVPTTD